VRSANALRVFGSEQFFFDLTASFWMPLRSGPEDFYTEHAPETVVNISVRV